jgi:tetratricopeptide (TPR) repeat protein
MDKLEVLNEVNRLVAAGLRRSAIEITQEYLEKAPNDSGILRALGRIFLLEKKPEQAIKYLQLSLKHSHDEINKKSTSETYELDDLNADDLAYIDETAVSSGDTYLYTCKDTPSKLVDSIPKQITNAVIPKPQSNGIIFDQKDKNKPQLNLSGSILNDLTSHKRQPSSTDSDFDQKRNLTLDFAVSNNINKEGSSSRNGDIFTTHFTSTAPTENWQDDLFNDEQEISIDESDLDDFEPDAEEGALIFSEIDDVLIEKEFSWDDLDEFDEIDDQDTFDTFNNPQILTEGKLDRWGRAKQIAVEVIQSHDWGKESLHLLQQVFYENGWAAARMAIERELAKGLTQEELELALYIRSIWTENQQYWISFIHITSNSNGQQTRAAYKNMSWPESLRIIRSFNNIPSEEEIQLFIDQTYDDWYCSPILQRIFKAFIRYLKYRTGSVRSSLSGNELFSFVDVYENESLFDTGYDFINDSEEI